MKKSILKKLLVGLLALSSLFAVGCTIDDGGSSSSGGSDVIDKTEDNLVSSFEEYYDCYHLWTKSNEKWRAERNRDQQYITDGEFSIKAMKGWNPTGEASRFSMGVPLTRKDGLAHDDFTNVISYTFDVFNITESSITISTAPAKIKGFYNCKNATEEATVVDAGEKTTITYNVNRVELDYGIGLTELTHLLVRVSGVDPVVYFDNFRVHYGEEEYIRPVLSDAITPGRGLVSAVMLDDSYAGGIGDGQDVRALAFDEKYGTVLKWNSNSNGSNFPNPRIYFRDTTVVGCDYIKFLIKIVPHVGYENVPAEVSIWLNQEKGKVSKENEGNTLASHCADWTTVTFEVKDNPKAFLEAANANGICLVTHNNGTMPFYFDVYIAAVECGYYGLESDGSVMDLTAKYYGVSAATITPTGNNEAVEIKNLKQWVPISGKLSLTMSKDGYEDRFVTIDVNAAAHEHAWEQMTNVELHWEECPCGEKKGEKAHQYDSDGYCEICGFENPLTHEHDFQYVVDGDRHWLECRCGEKQDSAMHDFSDGDCVCGRKPQLQSGAYMKAGTDLKNSYATGIWANGVAAGKDLREMVEDPVYGTVLKWTGSSGSTGFYQPRVYFNATNAQGYDYVKFIIKVVPHAGFEDVAGNMTIYMNETLGQMTYENNGTTYVSNVLTWGTVRFDAINNASAFENSATKGIGLTVYGKADFDFDVYIAAVQWGNYDEENPAPAPQNKIIKENALSNSYAAGIWSGGVAAGRDIRTLVDDAMYGSVLKWTGSSGGGFANPRIYFNNTNAQEYDYVKYTIKVVPHASFESVAASMKLYMNSDLGTITYANDGTTYASDALDWITVRFDAVNNVAAFENSATKGVGLTIHGQATFDFDVYIAAVELGYYDAENPAPVKKSTIISGATLYNSYAAGINTTGAAAGRDIREMIDDDTYGSVLKWSVSGSAGFNGPRLYFNNTTTQGYDYVKVTFKVEYDASFATVAEGIFVGLNRTADATTKENGGTTYVSSATDWITVTFDATDNPEAFADALTKGVGFTIHCNAVFDCQVYIASIECGYYND